jgi:hypothetical protein
MTLQNAAQKMLQAVAEALRESEGLIEVAEELKAAGIHFSIDTYINLEAAPQSADSDAAFLRSMRIAPDVAVGPQPQPQISAPAPAAPKIEPLPAIPARPFLNLENPLVWLLKEVVRAAAKGLKI